MAEERGLQLPHKLSLEERKKLTVSGVAEVVSFEESAVVLRTARGVLLVRGQDLHLKTLSLDGGQVAVEGMVSALIYEEPRREGGFFTRLFG
ncbi:MAG TPA: sporulation protein YabP [Candidatus Faecousia faecigallinarum]|nr:sporulation protein YabP [Candidatus Faecousia faecigallinarum]